MEILRDWKFYLFLFTLLNTGLSAFSFIVIKFNDFKHLGEAFNSFSKEVKKELKSLGNRLGKVEKSQAVLEDRYSRKRR